jgi:hypothetical protein
MIEGGTRAIRYRALSGKSPGLATHCHVEVMRVRDYPVENFDRRAEDISVDHPDAVRHWRWGPTR